MTVFFLNCMLFCAAGYSDRYADAPSAPPEEMINCRCQLKSYVLLPGERLVDGKVVKGLPGGGNGGKIETGIHAFDLEKIYREAKTGGRHSGKYKDAQKWSNRSLQKEQESYLKTAQLHLEKMGNPSKYDSEWTHKTIIQKNGLLKKWEKDYIRNMELEIIISMIMTEMGFENGEKGTS